MNSIKKISLRNILKTIEDLGAIKMQNTPLNETTVCGPTFREIKGVKDKSFYCHIGVSRYDFVKLCLTFDIDEMLFAAKCIRVNEWESSELIMYSENYTINKNRSRLIKRQYEYTRSYNNFWE